MRAKPYDTNTRVTSRKYDPPAARDLLLAARERVFSEIWHRQLFPGFVLVQLMADVFLYLSCILSVLILELRMADEILYSVHNGVALLRLNTPPVNLQTLSSVRIPDKRIARADREPSVRALMLSAAGGACSRDEFGS